MSRTRGQTKWEMIVDRGGIGAKCDWCHLNVGTQMHEIVSRSRTLKNDLAREASFDKHICALLCEECHVKHGHSMSANTMLLEYNITLYGREAVQKAWDNLSSLLYTEPNIRFPGGNRNE